MTNLKPERGMKKKGGGMKIPTGDEIIKRERIKQAKMTNPNKMRDWEIWSENFYNARRFFRSNGNLKTRSRLKDKWFKKFEEDIRSLLSQQRQELVREIEKMKCDDLPDVICVKSKDCPEGDTIEGFTYNQIIDDICSHLKKEE